MRRGHVEIELQPEDDSVVLSYRDIERRGGTLRLSRSGLLALAAIAERAARRSSADDPDDLEWRCAVKGEIV